MNAPISITPRRFGQTMRTDAWWAQPVSMFVLFAVFIIYSTWAGVQNAHYHFGNYLSPFYSPEIFGSSHHAWFGPQPSWWPAAIPFSPAFLILWAPGGFRVTCYYYRGVGYKALWADPPACGVGEPRHSYLGENWLPLILMNMHRYFLIPALALIVILSHDAWKAMWFADANGVEHFGIGVGTIVLTANAILLGGYTLGCHAFRHFTGGMFDQLSLRPARKKTYDCVSCLNRGHGNWALLSLVGVGFADLYVRMLSMGIWTDFRIL